VKKALSLKFQFIVLLLPLLAQMGCIKKTTVLPQSQRLLPAKNATRAELFQALETKSKQIETLKATVSLDLSRGGAKSGVLDEYRQTKGYVLVERPAHIRVQVQMPLVLTTVAVMVSDGKEYRVSVPPKNQFAVESVNAPISPNSSLSNLRPQIFLDGLFVDITPYAGKPALFEEAVVGIHSYYVFSFIDVNGADAQILEKIWIDRSDLEVARKQVFGKDGRLETDVDYQEYHHENGIPVPKQIVIHRPVEDLTVKMTFQQTTLNEKLDAKVFDLPRPEGSRLLQLSPAATTELNKNE
jgi:outer membrane lipoprotein-sorting protein